jgi:hypothetical protein
MSAEKTSLPTWKDYLQKLMPIGEKILKTIPGDHTPQVRQETWSTLFASLSQAYVQGVYPDPNYPEFTSIFNMAINLFAPVPDYMYTWTPVSDEGTYRLRGFRGTTRFVKLSLIEGNYAVGTNKGERKIVNLDHVNRYPDGRFDFVLSKRRPAGYQGEWIELPAGVSNIAIRSASYDWVNERDPVVAIERTDVPAQRPRLTAGDLAARLATLATWTEVALLQSNGRFPDLAKKNMQNRIMVHDYTGMGGNQEQIYLEGLYDLEDDEVLIMETEVPRKCLYWSFFLITDQMASVDWMNRQSSLNGFQAKLDSDGKFRAVMSKRDPGVPNWLDTGGYNYGIIHGRWHEADSSPEPATMKVKLAELRNHLPKDTPTVSAEQRDASLRERRVGAQFRRKW